MAAFIASIPSAYRMFLVTFKPGYPTILNRGDDAIVIGT
jgi:hypothetical protein